MGPTYDRARKQFISKQTPRWLIRRMIADSERKALGGSSPWMPLGPRRDFPLSKETPRRKWNEGPWTKQEDEYLRRWYVTFGRVRVASVLKRAPTTVCKRAQQLGLKVHKVRVWTKKEVEYVRRHCMKEELAQIARRLGRTEESVKQRARRLGFHKFVQGKNAEPRQPSTEPKP
jgi:hypothetical protein